MISALFYLQFNWIKNRLERQIQRLKQPKYLVFAVLGGTYLYFYLFKFLAGGMWRGGGNRSTFVIDTAIKEPLGAMILLAIVFLAWIIPHQRAALVFTEAEVAFLFPAPVNRRGLIHYKLLKMQLGLLFTVFFFTLISGRFGAGGHWFIRAMGWWVILFTLNLHFIASSFALTRLMDRGMSTWARRLIVLVLALAVIGVVGWWTASSMPQLSQGDIQSTRAFQDYFKQALTSGPLPYLLYPFRLVVRPYLAPDWPTFFVSLLPAALLMALHYVWVIRADVAFEEASVEASKRLAEKIASMRAGRAGRTAKNFKPKRPPFRLGAEGSPLMALLWKNLIAAGSVFTARLFVTLAIIFGVMSFSSLSAGSHSPWPVLVGGIAAGLGLMSWFLGPQIMRQDFRQDLQQADLLKLYPLRGWQVALGEVLAPLVILSAVQWLLIIICVGCFAGFEKGDLSPGLMIALGVSAAMIMPPLNLLSLIIANASALMFPAWFQPGKQMSQGLEATGQRIVFAFGQFLAMIVALVPAGAAFAIVWVFGNMVANGTFALPVASFAAAIILAVEGGFGVWWLGWLFDRFDLTTEQTA